jgi:serine protease
MSVNVAKKKTQRAPIQRVETTDRLIVKLRDAAANSNRAQPMSAGRVRALSNAAGTELRMHRKTSGGAHVMKLARPMSVGQVDALAKRLNADPSVAYAEADRRMYPQAAPSDTSYSLQWALHDVVGGINAPAAWEITKGAPSVVVAVVDSGILPHEDLAGRVLPGYDFTSEDSAGVFAGANDGDGRDADASDPGNWVTAVESAAGTIEGCTVRDSSWHGTGVAGVIAASTDNALGIAGANWNSKLLPVRAAGKCGAYISDLTDGVRWAAGLSVPNVPANLNPARVINVSFGSDPTATSTSCPQIWRDTITDVTGAGAVVITAAGNEATSASLSYPGNCSGVINVAATEQDGTETDYTNVGPAVSLSAPGGGVLGGVLTLSNSGLQSAGVRHDRLRRRHRRRGRGGCAREASIDSRSDQADFRADNRGSDRRDAERDVHQHRYEQHHTDVRPHRCRALV